MNEGEIRVVQMGMSLVGMVLSALTYTHTYTHMHAHTHNHVFIT